MSSHSTSSNSHRHSSNSGNSAGSEHRRQRSHSRSPSRHRRARSSSPSHGSSRGISDEDSHRDKRARNSSRSPSVDTGSNQSHSSSRRDSDEPEYVSDSEVDNSRAKKGGKKGANPDAWMLKFNHIARYASLVINDVDGLLSKGAIMKRAKRSGEEVKEEDKLTNREFETYLILIQHIPVLEAEYEKVCADEKASKRLCKKIERRMSSGRSCDTGNLKDLIFDLIAATEDPKKDLNLPAKSKSKLERGFHNYTMGGLLCPSNLTWSEELRERIIHKKVFVDASEFPLFVYADSKYTPGNDEEGLFYGRIGIEAAKVILTSPSSIKPDGKTVTTKAGNAKLAGITTITPRIIAYALVQVRLALSDQSQFNAVADEGEFSLGDFYWKIVTSLEESEKFKDGVIAHWNKEIFGDAAGSSIIGIPRASASKESALDRLRAQRAARAAEEERENAGEPGMGN